MMSTVLRSCCFTVVWCSLVAGVMPHGGWAQTATPADKEHEQIAILGSDAQKGDKAIACKRLAIYGGTASVPSLAALLSDPELASWARIALEAIPDAAADDALRASATALQGRLLVGVINSIGNRADRQAVPLLAEKLTDGDEDVASAAAVALGHIGGDTSAKALIPLLANSSSVLRDAVAEGCVLMAEELLAKRDLSQAQAIYDAVRNADVSKQRRAEGIRGAILSRQDAGIPLLVEQLKAVDKWSFGLGLRVARELPGPRVEAALLAELERATPKRQAYLLIALADRGDAAALPAALKLAKSVDPALRGEAVRVLGELGDASAAPALMAAALDKEDAVTKAARTALAGLAGPDIDAAVIAMLSDAQSASRLLAVELLSERQILNAIPLLLKAAHDSDDAIRVAAIKALSNQAGMSELAAVLDLLLKAPSAADLRAAEGAVKEICTRSAKEVADTVTIVKAVYGDLPDGRSSDVTKKVAAIVDAHGPAVQASNGNFGDPAGGVVKQLRITYSVDGQTYTRTVTENETIRLAAGSASPACIDAVLEALLKAPADAKLALLRILRSLGGAKALAAVRTAAGDASADTRETALRILCDWPDEDALPDLSRLAKTSDNPTVKILALRGYIRLVNQQEILPAPKLSALQQAWVMAERNEEKKLVLAALGKVRTVECLGLVTPHLADDQLREEACASVLAIAEKMPKPPPAQAVEAVKQVSRVTTNKRFAERAGVLLGN